MPKMKTKKSAAKRFRVRPGGTVKRGQAFKRHILTKKTTKNFMNCWIKFELLLRAKFSDCAKVSLGVEWARA